MGRRLLVLGVTVAGYLDLLLHVDDDFPGEIPCLRTRNITRDPTGWTWWIRARNRI